MEPLAYRMRPKTLEDLYGQEHIVGKDKLLYRLIKADNLMSLIFYGPPGTGKTSIANVIANLTNTKFVAINATTAAKKDMQAVTAKNERCILFVDEIHRFNKAQQDYLLPFVESGQIILIGATTENPYFSVNPALVSRSKIFELKPLDNDTVKTVINKAYDVLRSDGYNIKTDDSAVNIIAEYANGDLRAAINAAELSVLSTDPDETNTINITDEVAAECLQKPVLRYDPDGDNHYNIISAFIKSIRGSDPQAALYYLALMIQAGEDPAFIARRVVIAASEDIGLADSNGLVIATAAFNAVKNIGFPEAQIILSHAVIYLATAPKSNSACEAISKAMDFVSTHKMGTVPPYLCDAHYKSAEKLGRGVGYLYPHNYKDHYVPQEYLPEEYRNEVFYTPCQNYTENLAKKYLDYLASRKANNLL